MSRTRGPLRVTSDADSRDELRTRGVTRNARTLTERDVSHRGGPVENPAGDQVGLPPLLALSRALDRR